MSSVHLNYTTYRTSESQDVRYRAAAKAGTNPDLKVRGLRCLKARIRHYITKSLTFRGDKSHSHRKVGLLQQDWLMTSELLAQLNRKRFQFQHLPLTITDHHDKR